MAVDPALRLAIYNDALVSILGEDRVFADEDSKAKRVMDMIWNGDSGHAAVANALERHGWNFAMRTQELYPEASFTTQFGEEFVFAIPDDYARLESLATEPGFAVPLTARAYRVEAGFVYADMDLLYIRYVSVDPTYGLNSALWPAGFKKYLAGYLAFEAAEALTNDSSKQDRAAFRMEQSIAGAKAIDGMAEGAKFPPTGSWARTRLGSRRGDGGYRTSLIQR